MSGSSMICEHCKQEKECIVCETCGTVFCMDCYRVYSWQAHSNVCYVCQNKKDLAWLRSLTQKKKKRK